MKAMAIGLMLVVVGGCGGVQSNPTDPGAPCDASRKCPSGQFCFNGLCALGCNSNEDCASGQTCDTAGDRLCHNSGNPGTNNNTGTQAPCGSGRACPSGQFCFNGLCALGCNSNADCATDQYCDTEGDRLCHNKAVTTCPEVACATSQTCMKGMCTSNEPPATSCDPTAVASGNDGCANNALCFEENSVSKCYSFPACGESSYCPAGTYGSVCNDGLIPNKGRICLPGLCRSVGNCPSSWKCIKGNAADVIGNCSNGSAGMSCNTNADCLSGDCFTFMAGFAGTCM